MSRARISRAIAALLALVAGATLAATARADSDLPPAPHADVQLADPVAEAKAKALMETLRCLVCQGQSIADSNADLAGDMRSLVRERIAAGESPQAIRAFLVRRYGDWVSYAPPFDAATFGLWAAPLVLLVAGIALAARSLRRRR